ncbi:gliding motility-associated C-terminal domain-containing protein, partial [Flavobacterium sp.]|uniref:gliding motility-associated C-terminal domain-containing protein n=1 Tax=Flavobacterium sp. TaxID=239 RepID=UPI00286D87D1
AGTADYTVTTTTVTIPAGQTSITVNVPTTDDTTGEPTETFTLNGTVTSGNTSNTNPVGTGEITDNDSPVVTITGQTVTEGTDVVFTVALSNPSAVATTVDVVTTTGTAGTADYTVTTTTVTIPAGQTSVTVSVPTTDDTTGEPSESFTLNGTVTSGNTSNTTAVGTGEITDNDSPVVTITGQTVTEGTAVVFTVALSTSSSVATTVDVVTTTGTAGTSDYTVTTTTVTIPAGQTSVTVSVPTTDDTTGEPSESFTLNGTVTSGNTSNTNPVGTGVITDNDPITVTIVGQTVTEGTDVVFTVELSNPSSVATVVDVVTTTGTAGTADYTVTTITVTIPAGQTSVTVNVPTTVDFLLELTENFTLNGTVTSGNTSNTTAVGTGIILDNPPTINAENDSVGLVDGSVGGVAGNVLDDNGNGIDTSNGNSINIAEIVIRIVTPATPIVVNYPVPTIDLVTGDIVIPAGTPAGTYTIVYQICQVLNPSICDTATVTIVVVPENEIGIYNHITPNGDGDNEFFFIDGIENFPNNTVEIYNRWGVLVYEANGYNNANFKFVGTSNGRVTVQVNADLPEGTYYYILRYVNKAGITKEKAAYLYINR